MKKGLTEDEAEMYVIESNLIQRGFDNLKISQQVAVIALRYSEIFSPGKRNDIIREPQMLENPTSCPVGEKLNSTETLSNEYSMSSRNISRLLRINKLTFELKELVDSGEIVVRSGVKLSYLSKET